MKKSILQKIEQLAIIEKKQNELDIYTKFIEYLGEEYWNTMCYDITNELGLPAQYKDFGEETIAFLKINTEIIKRIENKEIVAIDLKNEIILELIYEKAKKELKKVLKFLAKNPS